MSALTVWSEAALAVREPRETTFVNALSLATVQLTSVSGPSPEPGTASVVGVTRVHSRIPSGSGSPEATPCRKAGVSVAAPAGSAATSGPARTAVAAAALTTVRRRGEGGLTPSVALYRLVTSEQVTGRYQRERANSQKFARSSTARSLSP